MISPHLLKVVASHSTSEVYYEEQARIHAHIEWEGVPQLMLKYKKEPGKWCHLVYAQGPGLTEDSQYSELVIIWWSEMGPDTERVLSAIDWEKHAKNV